MPISTRRRGWITELPLPADAPVQGVVLTDQSRTIDWRAREVRPAGKVGALTLKDARDALSSLIERE